jgi:hypothetical protein
VPQLAVGDVSFPSTTGQADIPAGRNDATGATGPTFDSNTGATDSNRGAAARTSVGAADAAVGTVNDPDATAATNSP